MNRSVFFSLMLLSILIGLRCNLDRIADAGPFECGQLFTDPRDGKTYKTIWIADDGSHDKSKPGKCWMAENLDFNTASFNSNCYADDVTRCDTFGHMYSDFAVKSVCMNGWHVATAQEWSDLFKTYGWTETFTGNGPDYNGDGSVFLPGGLAKLDFLMGGSCLNPGDCEGIGDHTSFWATDENNFCSFFKGGSSNVWVTAVIIGNPDLRYYIRCIEN